MEIIEWNESYALNIPEIDTQHKVMIVLINKLTNSINIKDNRILISEIIFNLFEYISNHFKTEEDMMTNSNYPESKEHFEEHLEFIKKVFEFKKDFNNNKKEISEDIINFLQNWLKTHIKETDKKMGNFLNKKNNSF